MSLHQEITAQIVNQLEKGVSPWSKPWGSVGEEFLPIMPRRGCGEFYRGINILLLMGAAQERGYRSATWMTFNQAKELNGCVRKGEKATKIVYASSFTKEDDQGEEQQIPFLKQYCVFNVEQIDGLPERFYTKSEPKTVESTIRAIEHAEVFFRKTGATIRHGGNKAFYSPSSDFVQMPPMAAFKDSEGYYGTLAHELTHWTGHTSRKDRTFGKRFGDQAYAIEELVAELGSAFLCAELGIELSPREDHAQYLASWLRVLKADCKAIFTAASKASEAATFILDQVANAAEIVAQPEPVEVIEPQPVAAISLVRDDDDDTDPTPPRGGRKPSRERSLVEFLAQRGLADHGGEVRAMDGHMWHTRKGGRRRLVRPDGLSLEHACELAHDAGYFPDAVFPFGDPSASYQPVTAAMLLEAVRKALEADFRAFGTSPMIEAEPDESDAWWHGLESSLDQIAA